MDVLSNSSLGGGDKSQPASLTKLNSERHGSAQNRNTSPNFVRESSRMNNDAPITEGTYGNFFNCQRKS